VLVLMVLVVYMGVRVSHRQMNVFMRMLLGKR